MTDKTSELQQLLHTLDDDYEFAQKIMEGDIGGYDGADGARKVIAIYEKVEAFVKSREEIIAKVNELFENLRFDESYHLGLGDIRLTVAQQEQIIELLENNQATQSEK